MQRIQFEDSVEYRLEGKRHRIGGPAVEKVNGTRFWYENGRLHRVGGPAIEWVDGNQEWYENGRRHRIGGPAVEKVNGNRVWYENGRLHRIGGPAVELADGSRQWWENGRLHKVGGPAVEEADGTREWWENGEKVPEPIQERVFEEEIRKTEAEDLVYKTPLEPGTKYLLCSFREDHVVDHGFMTRFAKTGVITRISCPYCRNPFIGKIFVQE